MARVAHEWGLRTMNRHAVFTCLLAIVVTVLACRLAELERKVAEPTKKPPVRLRPELFYETENF
jgi:hypothetical protein